VQHAGHIGLNRINTPGSTERGAGVATAGLCLGYLQIAVAVPFIPMMILSALVTPV
jgi:hypothetical protein